MACTWTRRREWIVLAVAVLIVLVVAVAVEGSARSGEYAQREFLLGELLPRTVSNMPQTVPQTVQQTVPQTVPQTAESSPPPPAESSDCGIFFNLDTDVFTLQTRRASYVMHVRAEDRLLEHVYWGERLHREDDVRYLLANNEIVSFDAGIKNALLLEYADTGTGDYRIPALRLRYADDGSAVASLQYRSHRFLAGGKTEYIRDGDGTEPFPHVRDSEATATSSICIVLEDALKAVEVHLYYTVYHEHDVITRSVDIVNRGTANVTLEEVASVQVDFPPAPRHRPYHLTQLSGSWARERQVVSRKLDFGLSGFDSRRGASSAQHNPFAVVSQGPLDEDSGWHYAFALVYSSSFRAQLEMSQTTMLRVTMGIHPDTFQWTVSPGEMFRAPEAMLGFSAHGMGALSRNMHALIRKELIPSRSLTGPPPVLVNSWVGCKMLLALSVMSFDAPQESMYFDCNEEKILEQLVYPGREMGVDMVVLDDGWFEGRSDDKRALGDWDVDLVKFPQGLAGLAEKVNAAGMQFGIWMEPEMISVESQLYRRHPDWCLHVEGRNRTEGRNQLVLDVSRRDVQDFMVESVSKVLNSANITYLKWDFNRQLTEVGSDLLAANRQGEVSHRWVLGLYSVLHRLNAAFPRVLIESCSGGGARFDLGLLFYTRQVWTSDNTDAVGRSFIQYGTSLLYPPSTMGAHVSVVPNHQVHRVTSLWTRHVVAMAGLLGYELTLADLSNEDRDEIRQTIVFWKMHAQPLVLDGDLYRLASPFTSSMDSFGGTPNVAAWMLVSRDRRQALVFLVLTGYYELIVRAAPLVLQGLDASTVYRVEQLRDRISHVERTLIVSGQTLMAGGVPVKMNRDADAILLHLVAVDDRDIMEGE